MIADYKSVPPYDEEGMHAMHDRRGEVAVDVGHTALWPCGVASSALGNYAFAIRMAPHRAWCALVQYKCHCQ